MRIGLVAAWVAVALVLSVTPPIAADGPCEDTIEERAGSLKWAVLSVVFSASSAISTRTTDREMQDDECVVLSVDCWVRAADSSTLHVVIQGGVGSYTANFKSTLLTLNDGQGFCPHLGYAEGTDGVLRVLFEG